MYFFDVAQDALDGALDRFSEFFKSPCFTASATGRELEAVDAEHAKNKQADMWLAYQLDKSTSDPEHPYHKFATGDSTTLRDIPAEKGINVRAALLNFHSKYYSANIMCLSVVGREPTSELAEKVKQLFGPVVNKDIPVPHPVAPAPLSPWKEGVHTGIVQYMVPVAEKRSLVLGWALPPQHEAYTTKPGNYYAHLVGHEGAGSILSLLKQRGLATGLSAGQQFSDTTWASFVVTVQLTQQGIERVDEIIEIVFSYLRMLRENGPQEALWEEERLIEENYIRFQAKSRAQNLVSQTAVHLQQKHMPKAHKVLGSDRFYTWDAGVVEGYLQHLTVGKLRCRVQGKEVADKCNLKEQWYGTEYGQEAFTDAQRQRWEAAQLLPELKLPALNVFIASDFSLKNTKVQKPEAAAALEQMQAAQARASAKGGLWAHPALAQVAGLLEDRGASGIGMRPVVPKLLEDSEQLTVTWVGDTWFGEPKTIARAQYQLPAVYASPRSVVLCDLFCHLLKECLNEFAYDASVADLDYNVSYSYGIDMTFGGFSHKLMTLVEKVLGRMRRLSDTPPAQSDAASGFEGFTDAQFDRALDKLARELVSRDKGQPVHHAMAYEAGVAVTPIWHYADKIAVIEAGITAADVRSFVKDVFRVGGVTVHVHGNATEGDAMALGAVFASVFTGEDGKKSLPPLPTQMVDRFSALVPEGTEVRYMCAHPNADEPNCSAVVQLQLGPDTTEVRAIASLLQQILQEPSFDVLRTKESLGYIVSTGTQREGGTVTLLVVVQSNKVPVRVLEGRIEAFLASYTAHLEQAMSDDDFAQHIAALGQSRLQAVSTLSAEARRAWAEISTRHYTFERDFEQMEYLMNHGSKAGVLAVLRAAVARGGTLRRKLAILIAPPTGTAGGFEGDATSDSRGHVSVDEEGGDMDVAVAAPPAVAEQVTTIAKGGMSILLHKSSGASPSIKAVFERAVKPARAMDSVPVLELTGRREAQRFISAVSKWPSTASATFHAWHQLQLAQES